MSNNGDANCVHAHVSAGAAVDPPKSAQAASAPVLVVGAGPVGLAAAAWLAEYGVPVRIIDVADAPSPYSKAFSVWRRTMAALAPLVPPDRWAAAGTPLSRITMCDAGRAIASVTLADADARGGHALPPGVLLGQAQTEALLTTALRERGVQVERGVRLSSFTADADGVDCLLERAAPAGEPAPPGAAAAAAAQQERVRTSYLIGSDGARSAVRRGLGDPFPGVTLSRRFLLADVEVDPPPGPAPAAAGAGLGRRELECGLWLGAMYLTTTSEGLLMVVPISPTACRVVLDGGKVSPDEPRVPPTLDMVSAALSRHTRLRVRPVSASWLSEFRINERVAARSAAGRVLLAGDAAHVHSPAGGQGMNLGLQDATNLAWKVALAHSGDAGPQLLDSYQAERQPAARRVVRMSGTILRTAMVRNWLLRRLRAAVMGVAMRLPAVRRRAAAALTGDKLAYDGSPLLGAAAAPGAPSRPGRMLPDVAVVPAGGGAPRLAAELLRGSGGGDGGGGGEMGLLVLGPAARREEWPTRFGRWRLAVRQAGVDLDLEGGGAQLVAALGIPADGGALVRPDGVVAASGGPVAAKEWLARHVGGAAAATKAE